ncbi:MAG: hypothetical protein QM660_04880 [Dysgonomonas sp.]
MKKILLTLLVFSVSVVLHSQNENPFVEFGYDVLVATSSKGEFQEFHDQTDIVEIGSVLFNRHTKEIVKVLDKEETTIDISSATAAMSIDPLCEKYYWISPYVYALNNPLRYVDPDGRLARDSVGNIIYNVTDRIDDNNNTRNIAFNDGRSVTMNYQYVTIYADDGTPIEVQQVTGATYTNSEGNTMDVMGNSVLQGQLGMDVMANCHGLTFGDGKFIMDATAVNSILKGDGYSQVSNPLDAQVGLVQDGQLVKIGMSGEWYHSARIDGIGLGTFREKDDIGKVRTGVPYHQIKNYNKNQNSSTFVTSYFRKR